MNKKVIIIGILSLIFIIGGLFFYKQASFINSSITISPTPLLQQNDKPTFSYKGIEGEDALTILKKIATVEQDASGLVTTINGRKADTKKKEFWALYINGQMAQVGPKEYITKEQDTMLWRIETY